MTSAFSRPAVAVVRDVDGHPLAPQPPGDGVGQRHLVLDDQHPHAPDASRPDADAVGRVPRTAARPRHPLGSPAPARARAGTVGACIPPDLPAPLELRRACWPCRCSTTSTSSPARLGLVLPGDRRRCGVSWGECRRSLGGADPAGPRRAAAAARPPARPALGRRPRPRPSCAERLRPVGLPVGHALHPGARLGLRAGARRRARPRARRRRPGPRRPRRAWSCSPGSCSRPAASTPALAWPDARDLLEETGALAAGPARPRRPRPAPTGRRLRRRDPAGRPLALRGGARAAQRAGCRPWSSRCGRRGWTRLGLVDPAFGPAAAAATAPDDRGFPRPLLVTADEVSMVRGRRPARDHRACRRGAPRPRRRRVDVLPRR